MKKILTFFLFSIIFLSNINSSFSIEPDNFIQSTVNRAAKTLGGNLTKEERVEKLKEIVTFMVENDKEYASANKLGYSVRLTGRGLDIGPSQEEE